MILVNPNELTNTQIDSGNIGVLGSVIHKMAESGEYDLIIIHNENKKTIPLSVQDNSENFDVHIDLSIDLPDKIEIKTNEYIVFYTTQSSGYEINIIKNNSPNPLKVFDNKELGEGDYFLVRIFLDGKYILKNILNNTEGTIIVDKLTDNTNSEDSDQTEIKCNDGGFEPSLINTLQGKIQLYEINTKSRIKISQLNST